MILIDLSKAVQTIVFYSSAMDESIFSLEITPESGNKSFQFQLENNLSNYVERSFIYELPTNAFEGLQIGLYNYTITGQSSLVTTKGKLMIKGIEVDDFITPDFEDDEDEIIFNG